MAARLCAAGLGVQWDKQPPTPVNLGLGCSETSNRPPLWSWAKGAVRQTTPTPVQLGWRCSETSCRPPLCSWSGGAVRPCCSGGWCWGLGWGRGCQLQSALPRINSSKSNMGGSYWYSYGLCITTGKASAICSVLLLTVWATYTDQPINRSTCYTSTGHIRKVVTIFYNLL
jgi:hypothetical protein